MDNTQLIIQLNKLLQQISEIGINNIEKLNPEFIKEFKYYTKIFKEIGFTKVSELCQNLIEIPDIQTYVKLKILLKEIQ